MELRSILTACTVTFAMTSVQSNNPLEEQFQKLFNSIVKHDTKESEIYRDVLKHEAVKERQVFDAMKEELRAARSRNSQVNRKNFHKNNYIEGVIAAMVKRDTIKNHYRGDSNEKKKSSEEVDYSRSYMDAVVATMELLENLNGTFHAISSEFEKIRDKFGINTTQVEQIIRKCHDILARDHQEMQYKFQASLCVVTIDRMKNPLKDSFVETMSADMDKLKEAAESIDNQYASSMVERIKDQLHLGSSDLYQFQDNIQEMMQNVAAVAATTKYTTISMGRRQSYYQ